MLNPYGHGDFMICGRDGCRTDPITGIYSPHPALDTRGIASHTVRTMTKGKVLFCGPSGDGGYSVSILACDGCTVRYCRLAEVFVSEGENVSEGQPIGTEGTRGGGEEGLHLHLEVFHGQNRIRVYEYLGVPNAVGTVCGG